MSTSPITSLPPYTNVGPDTAFSFKSSFPLRAGVLLIAETAIVSFVSAWCLLCVALYRVRRLQQHSKKCGDVEGTRMQPVSILFLFAIFMDTIQALGSILDARWAFRGEVIEGTYCTAQGQLNSERVAPYSRCDWIWWPCVVMLTSVHYVFATSSAVLKQIGNDGTAWFTIAIALMTFVQVVFPKLLSASQARVATFIGIGAIYLFIFLMILVPSTTIPHYYGNTGLWCWIAGEDVEALRLRIGSEYAYFWLAAAVSIACYGYIAYRWLQEAGAQGDRLLTKDALAMGWYPAAYMVQIFPISLVRFLSFRVGKPEPGHGWTIFAGVCFASSGMMNVLLWMLTGRQYGFTTPPDDEYEEEEGDMGEGGDDVDGTASLSRVGTGERDLGDDVYGADGRSTRTRRRGAASMRSRRRGVMDDAETVLTASPSVKMDTPVLPNGHYGIMAPTYAIPPSPNGPYYPAQVRRRADILPISATPIGMAAGIVEDDDEYYYEDDGIVAGAYGSGPVYGAPYGNGFGPPINYPVVVPSLSRQRSAAEETQGSRPSRGSSGGRSSSPPMPPPLHHSTSQSSYPSPHPLLPSVPPPAAVSMARPSSSSVHYSPPQSSPTSLQLSPPSSPVPAPIGESPRSPDRTPSPSFMNPNPNPNTNSNPNSNHPPSQPHDARPSSPPAGLAPPTIIMTPTGDDE